MNDELLALVLEALDGSGLDDRVADLVLAACDGSEALDAALGGAAVERPDVAAALDDAAAPGAYLAGIEVAGFRGIGPPARLVLEPGPGLTLVVGRNGSGKSSFAEALELLLTDENSRWQGKTKVWREAWRNLHAPGEARIVARFHVDGRPGTQSLRRRWEADDPLEAAHTEPHLGTAGAEDELAAWQQAVVRYRPFLSYSQLEDLLESPADLYTALNAVLGIEDVDAAREVLRRARLDGERAAKAVRSERQALLPELAAVDDARAAACHAALARPTPDLLAAELAVEGLVEGLDPGSDLAALRALAGIDVPDEDAIDAAMERLRAAVEAREAHAGTDAGRAHATAALLGEALDFHADHEGDDCPICGAAGTLGGDWADRAAEELERLTRQAEEVDEAIRAVDAAIRALANLVPRLPQAADHAAELGLDPEPARAAVLAIAAAIAAERLLADGRRLFAEAAAAGAALRDAAAAEIERRDDAWRPAARRVQGWLVTAREAEARADGLRRVKVAEDWLTATANDLRDRRLAPIRAASQANWAALRQGSNVSLGEIVLRGTGTQRRAEFDVRVDDAEASALGVMSQGELNALALSVFLPRATLPASPFRFVVIDDPVQSMDPAKVDGLARVLAQAATGRQVVVFTHDDRLPEAVRRLQLPAAILQVTRRAGSQVDVRAALDPVQRALDDARAVVLSPEVPGGIARRIVPGFCREALEAAADAAIRRRRLARGDGHADVEAAIGEARKLLPRLALAIHDDAGRGGDVYTAVNNGVGRGAGDAIRDCNAGVHEAHAGDLDELVRETQRVCTWLASR